MAKKKTTTTPAPAPESARFKIGDRVRVRQGADASAYFYGREGVVTEIEHNMPGVGDTGYYLHSEDGEIDQVIWWEDDLEPASAAPAQPEHEKPAEGARSPKYRHPDGRILEVCSGFGEPPVYFTAIRKPSGSAERYKSKSLPPRPTREEAQSDLDFQASEVGWERIWDQDEDEDGESGPPNPWSIPVAPPVETEEAAFKVGDLVRVKPGVDDEERSGPAAITEIKTGTHARGDYIFLNGETHYYFADELEPVQLPAAGEGGDFRFLSPGQMAPHPKNRPVSEQSPKFLEFLKSVRTQGVLNPVLVRPLEGRFEIMAGARRWRAAVLAGLATVPVIVRQMDDRQALEVRIHENMHRQDPDPIEEARTLAEMLEMGYSPADAAARLGKSAAWVAQRARLTALIPEFAQAFQEGGFVLDSEGELEIRIDLSQWSVRAMELVARLPEETQRAAWTYIAEATSWDKGRIAVYKTDEVADWLDRRFMRLLGNAPWDLKRAYGACSPCAACPRRSQAQPDLFADDGEADRCLDMDCYEIKFKAFLEANAKEMKQKHPELVLVSRSYETENPELLPYSDFNFVSEGTEGARPALVMEGYNISPALVWIKTAERGQGARREPTPEERAAERERKVHRAAVDSLMRLLKEEQERLRQHGEDPEDQLLTFEEALRIASVLGLDAIADEYDLYEVDFEQNDWLAKIAGMEPMPRIELIVRALERLIRVIDENSYRSTACCRQVCELLRLDFETILEDAATKVDAGEADGDGADGPDIDDADGDDDEAFDMDGADGEEEE